MASTAYANWHGDRRARIEELLDVHQLIGSKRRWGTTQINSALVLRLAAEFQGFCRELHTGAVDHFVVAVAGENRHVAKVLDEQLGQDRKLDRGNANPSSLGSDFDRLGLALWPELADVRNAIAHADDAKLGRLKEKGYPVTLRTVRDWLKVLDSLATEMGDLVSTHMQVLVGGGRPW